MPRSEQPERRALMIEMPFEVKTYDIDHFGHVNNAVYVRWLEDLRLRFLDVYFPLQQQLEQGFAPIIASTEIHYKKGILLFDKPIGRLWIRHLSRAIFTLGAEITVDGQIATIATQRGVFADLEKMKAIRIPKELRERWEDAVREGR